MRAIGAFLAAGLAITSVVVLSQQETKIREDGPTLSLSPARLADGFEVVGRRECTASPGIEVVAVDYKNGTGSIYAGVMASDTTSGYGVIVDGFPNSMVAGGSYKVRALQLCDAKLRFRDIAGIKGATTYIYAFPNLPQGQFPEKPAITVGSGMKVDIWDRKAAPFAGHSRGDQFSLSLLQDAAQKIEVDSNHRLTAARVGTLYETVMGTPSSIPRSAKPASPSQG